VPILLEKHHTNEYWTGIGFPPIQEVSTMETQKGLDLIYSSLIQIFNTLPGSRVMYPEFGTNLRRILWDPLDDFLKQDLEFYTREAIQRWEPRIIVEGVSLISSDLDKNRGIAKILFEFRLKTDPEVSYSLDIPVLIG